MDEVKGENAIRDLFTELDGLERKFRSKYTDAQVTLKDTRKHADNVYKTLVELAIRVRDRKLGKLLPTHTDADAAPINKEADEAIASALAGQVKEGGVGDKVFNARVNDMANAFWSNTTAAWDKFWKAHPHLPEPANERTEQAPG